MFELNEKLVKTTQWERTEKFCSAIFKTWYSLENIYRNNLDLTSNIKKRNCITKFKLELDSFINHLRDYITENNTAMETLKEILDRAVGLDIIEDSHKQFLIECDKIEVPKLNNYSCWEFDCKEVVYSVYEKMKSKLDNMDKPIENHYTNFIKYIEENEARKCTKGMDVF